MCSGIAEERVASILKVAEDGVTTFSRNVGTNARRGPKHVTVEDYFANKCTFFIKT